MNSKFFHLSLLEYTNVSQVYIKALRSFRALLNTFEHQIFTSIHETSKGPLRSVAKYDKEKGES